MKITEKQQKIFNEAIRELYEINNLLYLQGITETVTATDFRDFIKGRAGEHFDFSEIEKAIDLLSILESKPFLDKE